MTRLTALALALLLGGCNLALPPDAVGPDRTSARLTCGGGDSFPIDVLAQPPGAETADDPAAAALREHLARSEIDIDWLPDTGWRVAVRTDGHVLWLAEDPGAPGTWLHATTARDGAGWRVTGWGGCSLQPDVGPGLGIASFRVAPHAELGPDSREIDVLVTEHACNSGEDASGRIVPPAITVGEDAITVLFAVRSRAGPATCPSNPETPFVLELPEALGDRVLLDGSSVPARDATECPHLAPC